MTLFTGYTESVSPLPGVCGLYCGACYHYRASFPEGEHLLEEAARQGRQSEGFTAFFARVRAFLGPSATPQQTSEGGR